MNELTQGNNLPAEYRALLEQLEPDTNLGGSDFASGNRISIKGSTFRKIVGGEEVGIVDSKTVDIVIVKAAVTNRMYYKDKWVEGETSSPTCWSADDKFPAPEVPVETRQHGDCKNCPMNIKGSGEKESKACRYQKRIAIVLAGDDGDNIPAAEVFQLILPATSIFGGGDGKMPMSAYAKYLHAHKTPAASIITEMAFDTGSSTPKLSFKPVRPLSEGELRTVLGLQQHPDTIEAVTLSVYVEGEGSNPDPAPAGGLFPVAEDGEAKAIKALEAEEAEEEEEVEVVPKESAVDKRKRLRREKLQAQLDAMEEEDEEEEEETPEPEVKAKKKVSPPKPSDKGSVELDSVLSEWDDEDDD